MGETAWPLILFALVLILFGLISVYQMNRKFESSTFLADNNILGLTHLSHSPEPTTSPTFIPNVITTRNTASPTEENPFIPPRAHPTVTLGPTHSPRNIGANESTKPNILFFLTDDLSWNSMGYEDFDLTFVTPFMTSMAENGVIMNNYYSQELCMPARTAFLTGRYPVNIGTQYDSTYVTSNWGLNISEVLWPQLLQGAGYRSYMLGKWGIGHYNPRYLPTARGFDYFVGYMSDAEEYWSKRLQSDPQFHDFMYSSTECYAQYNGTDREKYSTFFYRDKAVRIIEEFDFEDGDPLLLYVAFQAVHDPFTDDNTYAQGIPKGYLQKSMYDNIHANVTGRKRRQYAMALSLVDEAVQSVWNAMVAKGQENNTYVIFSSDNGGCYNAGGRSGPLRGTKGSLWEGGTKVNAWIYSALISPPLRGSRYNGIMHVTDWFPTILELTGVSYTEQPGHTLDGYSQVEAWKNESANKREYLLYNLFYNVDKHSFDMWENAPVAVRNSQYKLIHAFTGDDSAEWWSYDVGDPDDDNSLDVDGDCGEGSSLSGTFGYFLFDLKADPYEENNMYDDDEGMDDIKTELYSQIYSIMDKATLDVTASSKISSAALSQWRVAGDYVSPWIPESAIDPNATYPRACSFFGSAVSPDWPSDDDEPFLNETWAQRRSNDQAEQATVASETDLD